MSARMQRAASPTAGPGFPAAGARAGEVRARSLIDVRSRLAEQAGDRLEEYLRIREDYLARASARSRPAEDGGMSEYWRRVRSHVDEWVAVTGAIPPEASVADMERFAAHLMSEARSGWMYDLRLHPLTPPAARVVQIQVDGFLLDCGREDTDAGKVHHQRYGRRQPPVRTTGPQGNTIVVRSTAGSRVNFRGGELRQHLQVGLEVARALKAAGNGYHVFLLRALAVMALAMATGRRHEELLRVKLSDLAVNPAHPEYGPFGWITIRHIKATRGNPRPAPMTVGMLSPFTFTLPLLHAYLTTVRPCLVAGLETDPGWLYVSWTGDRLSKATTSERNRVLRLESGLTSGHVIHSFRGSFGAKVLELTGSYEVVRLAGGWRQTCSVIRYLRERTPETPTAWIEEAIDAAVGAWSQSTVPSPEVEW